MPRSQKEKRRCAASPYALFVKEHNASTRDQFSRPQERIKHIAQLWRDAKTPTTTATVPAAEDAEKTKMKGDCGCDH